MTDTFAFSLRNVGRRRPGPEGFHLRVDALDVPRGGLTALIGPSGCGKSTTLDLLSGILRPDAEQESRLLFSPAPGETADILDAWRRDDTEALAAMRRRHMGCVLQTGGLVPFLTAEQNMLLPCAMLGMEEERRDDVLALAGELGVRHVLRQMPETLSVGERQRTAIVRALAHRPAAVLADEPTAALDPGHARDVLGMFASLAAGRGCTVIMVTHAPEMAGDAGFSLIGINVERDGNASVSRLDHRRADS